MFSIEDIIEARKQWDEFAIQYEANNPEVKKRTEGSAQFIRAKLLNGEIIDPSLRTWLDAEISSARTVLIVGMVLTSLIQGQIFIWIIMYIAYRCRVKQAKKKAWARNIKDYGRYL